MWFPLERVDVLIEYMNFKYHPEDDWFDAKQYNTFQCNAMQNKTKQSTQWCQNKWCALLNFRMMCIRPKCAFKAASPETHFQRNFRRVFPIQFKCQLYLFSAFLRLYTLFCKPFRSVHLHSVDCMALSFHYLFTLIQIYIYLKL